MGTHPGLEGRRVLVVEDEAMIAMDMEATLVLEGCVVVGPALSLRDADRLAENEQLDAALLDINLAGGTTFGVADRLAGRGIPFVFLTGYGSSVLPERFRGRPICHKPCSPQRVLQPLRAILGG